MSMKFPVQSALPTCLHHPDEELVSYCSTCHERICEECLRGRHMTHEWKLNKKAARDIRQYSNFRCEEIEGMIGSLNINKEEERKAEIDRIENTRVKWVSTINAIAENLKDKTRAEGTNGISAEELAVLKKMLIFFRKDIDEADDNVAVEMEEEFHKKKQNLSSQKENLKKKLVFKEKALSPDIVQHMFGDVVEDRSEVKVTERSHFTHIDDSDYVRNIVVKTNNEALIRRYKDKHIHHVDMMGKTVTKPKDVNGEFVPIENNIIHTDFGSQIISRITSSDIKSDICSTAPLYPNGICQSYDGGLLVALCSCDVAKITSDSYGEVHHIEKSGGIIRKYSHTEVSSDKLFINAYRVAQNINTDLCVVDIIDKEWRSRLVVISVTSKRRFIYTGQPHLMKKFTSTDVSCDHNGRILLTDCYNHAVHLLRDDGHFLQFILTKQSPLLYPLSLDLRGDSLWVGCHNGVVRVYKYDK